MSRDDDLLERATRALRATPPPNDGELAQAKLRMLAAHQAATKKGGGRTLRWVLPLAAVLAAGTALAATPQGRELLANVVNRVVGYEILAHESKPAAEKPATKRPAQPAVAQTRAEPAAEPSVAQPVVAEPVVAEPTQQPRVDERPHHAKAKRHEPAYTPEPALAVEPAPSVQEPAPSLEAPALLASTDLAKYKAAHKAHFQDRDFALALRNWEAYLRQFPNGTFAIEARYNRAICLLRLGRNDEARRALTPFSKGEIGAGYRQAEATKLLEALE